MAAPMSSIAAEAVASNAGRYGTQAWEAFKARSPTAAKSGARGIRESLPSIKPAIRAPRQLTSHVGKTAGRNSAGQITIFHRGGGAKQLYRKIDLKRSTPCMGIIERIEYDPNRSARISLVRWEDSRGVPHLRKKEDNFVPPNKSLELTAATPCGVYSLSPLSSLADKNKIVEAELKGTYAMIGGDLSELKKVCKKVPETMKTCTRDVLLLAFSRGRKDEGFLNIPRVTVAGANPSFYAAQMQGREGKNIFDLSEIGKWDNKSSIWAHRLKPKAAVPWHSSRLQDSNLGRP